MLGRNQAILSLGFFLAPLSAAWAQPSPSALAAAPTLLLPAVAGQSALRVDTAGGVLRARACPGTPCEATGAPAIPVGNGFVTALPTARLQRVPIGQGRFAALVVLTAAESSQQPGQKWVTVLAAPPDRGEARVLFNDVADPSDQSASIEPNVIRVSTDGNSGQLLVGTRHPDVTLCGRPAMLSPQVLDPVDVTLKPVKLQRLDRGERDRAPALSATRRQVSLAPPLGRLVTATGASSGDRAPGNLTDGNPDTFWSEGRGGEGRGEFVTLRVPPEVPVTRLSFAFRPATGTVEGGAAPKRLWLAADQGLWRIDVPEDGWQTAGSVYDVTLPAPLTTSCLAVVLDDVFVRGNATAAAVTAGTAVTFSEIEARTAFDDEQQDVAGLVSLLHGGEPRARAAGAVLLHGGIAAQRAVAARYEGMDEIGRLLALDVLDQASCEEAAPTYARALGGALDSEILHARTRLERCRRAAAPALTAAVRDAAHPARVSAALILAFVAPDMAVETLLQRPDPESPLLRSGFRRALARAAVSPRAASTVARLLADSTLSPPRTLELLRASGDALTTPALAPAAATALQRFLRPGASFADRYLTLSPVAALARGGDPFAAALLRAALTDRDDRLRTAATPWAARLPTERARTLPLTGDPSPRVREALALALRPETDLANRGNALDESGRNALRRLLGDEWTFVRVATFDGLSAAGPDQAVDKSLLAALGREQVPAAQSVAIDAIARRRITSAGPLLRRWADDQKRALEVRARAVEALGGVCHHPSADALTAWIKRGFTAGADATDWTLARAALPALGRLHPPDLARRLAPFRAMRAERSLSLALRAAWEEKDVCPGPT